MSLAIRSNSCSERSSCGAASLFGDVGAQVHGRLRPQGERQWEPGMADLLEGAGKHAEPVPDARWTAMAHRRRTW